MECVRRVQEVRGRGGEEVVDLFVGNSGTTARFLIPALLHYPGSYRVDGVPRMRERPMRGLIEAMRQLGAEVRCLDKTDALPILLRTYPKISPYAEVEVEKTSQFLSGLLMALPLAAHPQLTLQLSGPLQSEPYVAITLRMMAQFGLKHLPVYDAGAHCYRIMGGQDYAPPEEYGIEPDASAASYFMALAAIHAGSSVFVPELTTNALQGDVAFAQVLSRMGAEVEYTEKGIRVTGTDRLCGVDVDMNAISDTVMTLAAIAPLADSPTTIRNVAHIRLKESDRIAATATELRRLGVRVEEREDGLRIFPTRKFQSAEIETYEDHRIAMAFAVLGTRVSGMRIRNPKCVAKTFPGFFEVLEQVLRSSRGGV